MRAAREKATQYAEQFPRGENLDRMVTALANQYALSAAVAREIVKDALARKRQAIAAHRQHAPTASVRKQARSRIAGQLSRAEMYATASRRKTSLWRDRKTRTPEDEAKFQEYSRTVRADIRAFKRGELAPGETQTQKGKKSRRQSLWAIQAGVPGKVGVYTTTYAVTTEAGVRRALKAASENNRSIIAAGRTPGAWPFAYKLRALFTDAGITADDVIKHYMYGVRTEVPVVGPDATLRDVYKKMNFVQAKWAKVVEGGAQIGTFSMRDYLRAFLAGSDPGSPAGRAMLYTRKTKKGEAGSADPGVLAKLRTVMPDGEVVELFTRGEGKPPALPVGRRYHGPQPITEETYLAHFVEWHEDDLETLVSRIAANTGQNFILMDTSDGSIRITDLATAQALVKASDSVLAYLVMHPPRVSHSAGDIPVCGDPWAPTKHSVSAEVAAWEGYSQDPELRTPGMLKPVSKTRVVGITGVDTGRRGIIEAARAFAKRRKAINVHLGEDFEDFEDPDDEVAALIEFIASVRQRRGAIQQARRWLQAKNWLQEVFETYGDSSWEDWEGDYDDNEPPEEPFLEGLHHSTLRRLTQTAYTAAQTLAPYVEEDTCHEIQESVVELNPTGGRAELAETLAQIKDWADQLDVTADRLMEGKVVSAHLDYADEWEDLRENAVKTLLKVETGRRLRNNPGITDLRDAYRAAVKAAQRNGWFENGRITDKGINRLKDAKGPARKFAEAVRTAKMEAWLRRVAAPPAADPRPNPTGVPLSGINVVSEQMSPNKLMVVGRDVQTHEYRPIIRVPDDPSVYGRMAGKTVRPRIQIPAAALIRVGALEVSSTGKTRLTSQGRAILARYRAEATRRVLEAVKGDPQTQYVAGEVIPRKRASTANVGTARGSKRWDSNPRGAAYRQEIPLPADTAVDLTGFAGALTRLRDKMAQAARGRKTYKGVGRADASALVKQLNTLLFSPDPGRELDSAEQAAATRAAEERNAIHGIVARNPARFTAIDATRDRNVERAVNQMWSLLEEVRDPREPVEVKAAHFRDAAVRKLLEDPEITEDLLNTAIGQRIISAKATEMAERWLAAREQPPSQQPELPSGAPPKEGKRVAGPKMPEVQTKPPEEDVVAKRVKVRRKRKKTGGGADT